MFFNHGLPVGINSSAVKHACADKPKPVYPAHVRVCCVYTCTHTHTQCHVLQTVENSMLSGQAPAKSLNCETKNTSSKTCDFRPLFGLCFWSLASRAISKKISSDSAQLRTNSSALNQALRQAKEDVSSPHPSWSSYNLLTKSQVIGLPKTVYGEKKEEGRAKQNCCTPWATGESADNQTVPLWVLLITGRTSRCSISDKGG